MTISNFFIPNRQQVSSITNSNPGVVTTTQSHGYESGYEVRFFFPLDVGMNQLNEKVVTVTKIDDTNFSIGIDTSQMDLFSPVGSVQVPEVIPVGSFVESVLLPTQNNENITPEL